MLAELRVPGARSVSSCGGDTWSDRLLTLRWGTGPYLALVGSGGHVMAVRRRCTVLRHSVRLARSWGYAGLTLADLDQLGADSVASAGGEDQSCCGAAVQGLAADHDLIVLAWGAHAAPERGRRVAAALWRALGCCGGALGVLGWTSAGQPCEVGPAERGAVTAQCLTAGAHTTFDDVDRRWSELLWVPEAFDMDEEEVVR